MFTGIPNGIKKFIVLLFGLHLLLNTLQCQPIYLQPEIDMNSSLVANSVRTVKLDPQNRLWVGTDAGLNIFSDNKPALKAIIQRLGNAMVWDLFFADSILLIATHNQGLYIYRLPDCKPIQYFDTVAINQIRKIRKIANQYFILTNAESYKLINCSPTGHDWQLRKLYFGLPQGFVSDLALFNQQVYGCVANRIGTASLTKLINDSFLVDRTFQGIDKGKPNLLSAYSNDSILVLGGDTKLTIVQNRKLSKVGKTAFGAIWDIEPVDGKLFIAAAEPMDERLGNVYELGATNSRASIKELSAWDLQADSLHKGLWIGTVNKGLFFWPNASSSFNIEAWQEEDDKLLLANKAGYLLYNSHRVINVDPALNKASFVFISPPNDPIKSVIQKNDTTIILTSRKLVVFKNFRKVFLKEEKSVGFFNATAELYLHNNTIFLFSRYNDLIGSVNLVTKAFLESRGNCVQIKSYPYRNNLIYFSSQSGFYYFDSIPHLLSKPISFIEDYTICGDSLWVLNAGNVSCYLINLKNFTLQLTASFNLRSKLPAFSPQWLVTVNKEVYVGNLSGMLSLDKKDARPVRYYYLGNFSQAVKPISDDRSLFFFRNNYIEQIFIPTASPGVLGLSVAIVQTEGRYENTPLSLVFQSPDYWLQQYCLKRVQFFKGNHLEGDFFTLDTIFILPTGLPKGSYTVKVWLNGRLVPNKYLTVDVALLKNPWFYLFASLFGMLLFFIIFKLILDKRSYERLILANRLQLLKQNLNPHFIFNSLNLIYLLVLQNKNEGAIKAIHNFADLHRYYLDNINKNTITLFEELKFIESYLRLEQAQTNVDKPFDYFIQHEQIDALPPLLLPPLILQPLVENAVKYGGYDAVLYQKMNLWIDVRQSKGRFFVGIENTKGNGKSSFFGGTGVGIKIVQERIDIFNVTYGKKLFYHGNLLPIHCNIGYRCELEIVRI